MLAFYFTPLLYGSLIFLIALLVIALIVGYELLRRDFKRLAQANEAAERALDIGRQLADLKRQMESGDTSLGDRLRQTNDIIGQVSQSLGAIGEASQQIHRLGTELASLSDALRMPGSAPSAGASLWLADLLGQMLPAQHYQLNVSLGNGRPVDAVVRLGNFLVAIDGGFPLPDLRRDGNGKAAQAELEQAARQHVDRVATACIQVDHGTVDFALMYLPTESLYYDLVIREQAGGPSLSNYALSRRVIPVSPSTLYAYLYTIVLGLRGLQIEQQAGDILVRLDQLRRQFSRFEDSFRGVGIHLDRATSRYDQASRQLNRLSDRLDDALPRSGRGLLPPEPAPDEPITADSSALPTLSDQPAGPKPPVVQPSLIPVEEPAAAATGAKSKKRRQLFRRPEQGK